MDAFTVQLNRRGTDIRPGAAENAPSAAKFLSREHLDEISKRRSDKDASINESPSTIRIREIKKKFPHLSGPIQEILFSEPFSPDDFKMLEVDKALLKNIEQNGEQLIVRGRASDFAVACTSSRTFQIKECESSNSILLLPDLCVKTNGGTGDSQPQSDHSTVVAISKTYLEMVELTSTYSTRLRQILEEHYLELFSNEDEDGGDTAAIEQPKPVTWSHLSNEVQLSELQLGNALKKYSVIDCDDGFYLLSAASQRRILDAVVEMCDDFDTPQVNVGRLSYQALAENLPFDVRFREPIANWFMESFCNRTEEDGYYSLNSQRVCRARASEVFSSDKKRDFPLDLFSRLVERTLPSGVDCRLDCLDGIAYFDENIVTGPTVRSLDIADLPDSPRERLEHLFSIKTMWKRVELQPYVLDYCSGPSGVEEFLMKHCRIVRKGDEKLFLLKPL